ncbi:MAG: tRNA (adenosine(37)-N6)-threonylcarbamoyltransferase complex ATPase subunit type 1 TsaE [Rhizobiaceae bacterium]
MATFEPALERFLPDEAATARLGEDIAAALMRGDLVTLKGDLGAGKTTLARGLIRALAGDPRMDVPSPTFTLVQAYDGVLPIAHLDLYRLSSPEELDELGLDEALKAGAALVEWPERGGDRLGGAILVTLSEHGEGRMATIAAPSAARTRIERSFAARDFLTMSGRREASRLALSGDASARRYERVESEGEPTRLLMDSPPLALGPPVRDGRAYAEIARSARTVNAFVGIDAMLRDAGFAAPEVLAADILQGFLLVEHLGVQGMVDAGGRPLPDRYRAAAELLASMHVRRWPDRIAIAPGVEHLIPPFDREAVMIELSLLLDWYVPHATGAPPADFLRRRYEDAWTAALDRVAGAETTLMLRDVHSPNLIWRGERTGHDRIGLIDFQDALIGPAAYDVASLALDARVTMAAEVEADVAAAYVAARRAAGDFDEDGFRAAYAVMGAQRNSKILGIFVRLDRRDGKPQYLKHLPRMQDYLARSLAHPALREVAALYRELGIVGVAG